jgi:glycosyltransferase involved in cell wall biosynthesis
MSKVEPLISFIIPTYNRARLVKRAVESVLIQNGVAFEVIVVDDGSTDETSDVLNVYGDAIRFVHQKNAGVESARMLGVNLARGSYIWFLDSDDRLLPGALSAIYSSVLQKPSADVIYGWALAVEQGKPPEQRYRPVAEGRVWMQYLFSNLSPVGTFVVRRKCLSDFAFDTQVPPYEDWDFLLRLAFQVEFACVPALVAEIEYQPVRRTTGGKPKQILSSVRRIYSKLMADPISGPLVRDQRRYLDANAYVALGHHYRVLLDNQLEARRAFLQAVRIAPDFRRAYTGLFQSLLGNSVMHTLRQWRTYWFTMLGRC